MSLRASVVLLIPFKGSSLACIVCVKTIRQVFFVVVLLFSSDTVFCLSLAKRKSLSQETKLSCLWPLQTLRRFSASRMCTNASSSLCVLCCWGTETLHHRYMINAPYHSDKQKKTKQLYELMMFLLYRYVNYSQWTEVSCSKLSVRASAIWLWYRYQD